MKLPYPPERRRVRLAHWVAPGTRESLKRLARQRGTSMGETIDQLVQSALKRSA